MQYASRAIAHLLITSLLMFPFVSTAGLINTEQSVVIEQDAGNRIKVSTFINRSDVASLASQRWEEGLLNRILADFRPIL